MTTPMKALELSKSVHQPQEWLESFAKATNKQTLNKPAISSLRVLVMYQTMRACREECYYKEDGTCVKLDSSMLLSAGAQSRMIDAKKDEQEIASARLAQINKYPNMEVKVMVGDCLEAALLLKQQYGEDYPVAVLNMANAYTPGGGYRAGCGAQEENLHRRSNLYQCLDDPDRLHKGRKWYYPIAEFAGIFTPNAAVFRSSEAKGYTFYDRPHTVSFLTVAAYNRPSTIYDTNRKLRLSKEAEKGTKKKIRHIIDMALVSGMKSVVLCAFGAGAFGNPPDHIAEIFQQVLQEYPGAFEHVIFAIFNDHNSHRGHNPEGNVVPFERVFGKGTEIVYND